MKKLTFSLCALFALGSLAFAGTEAKDSKAVVPPPCPQWYADSEFNISLSGVYAFSGNENTFLDHGWGGAVDAKYFFHRYFGIGVQGFFLSADRDNDFLVVNNDDNSDGVGGVLGTFTVRFPMSCSRFAPYVWIGGGGVWGNGNDAVAFNVAGAPVRVNGDDEGHAMGQVGGGFEVRFTPHFGWQNDISWNIVSGSNNNFGMARSGLNFAF
jgi:Outer membrane protein beta-barrel domain